MGITYYNLENYEEAREQFTHSFKLKREFKDAVFNEAAAYIKLREFNEAIISLEIYNQIESNDHESFFLRGYLLKVLCN